MKWDMTAMEPSSSFCGLHYPLFIVSSSLFKNVCVSYEAVPRNRAVVLCAPLEL